VLLLLLSSITNQLVLEFGVQGVGEERVILSHFINSILYKQKAIGLHNQIWAYSGEDRNLISGN